MIIAGQSANQPALVKNGLNLLGWLLEHESGAEHLSMTPVGGAGPDDVGPRFDQQPIEVAALADACARAATISDDSCWPRGVEHAIRWFLGDNDAGTPMWDPSTGGGFDGLHREGANQNQGAESTLALVATLQHARNLVWVTR
jgi:hypothetical protein